MKNREALNNMCMYDLLCRLNTGNLRGDFCIIETLSGYDVWKSRHHYDNCDDCIADWLNEESTIPLYERRDNE